MKMISESKYEYKGAIGAWHLFVSREVGSDREILCVQRARYLLKSGGTKVFNRLVERNEGFKHGNRITLEHIRALTKGESQSKIDTVYV